MAAKLLTQIMIMRLQVVFKSAGVVLYSKERGFTRSSPGTHGRGTAMDTVAIDDETLNALSECVNTLLALLSEEVSPRAARES